MAIDMEQFRQVYLEESFEGLEIMESGLLELDPGKADSEEINTIFRAAHSIKGGSATFGFKEVTGFTHIMETLLDQMRSDEREVTPAIVDLLLRSVDCLHEMFVDLKAGDAINQSRVDGVQEELERMLGGESATTASAGPDSEAADGAAAVAVTEGWEIVFVPFAGMLKTGNEPLRILRALRELGELEVVVERDQVPTLEHLQPEECALGWKLRLKGAVARDEVTEIFEWVEDDCELSLTEISAGHVAQEQSQQQVADASQSVVAAAPKEAGATRKKASGGNKQQSSSIRVAIEKVDALVDMIGELVITQSMLSQIGDNFTVDMIERMREGLAQLERNTRELQESVMQIRMLPISFAFNRFPRVVHDLSATLGKKVELVVSGEGTELDKTVLEQIGDPLVHLVRNSIDHGIELPDVRVANGKPEVGTVNLNAYHQGGNIVIEVSDDGAGLNKQAILNKATQQGLIEEGEHLSDADAFDLLFRPGFSTAKEVTDVSGRGVGMDVVRRNVRTLGGNVEVTSNPGVGSTFIVRLPLTLAILDGQLLRIGNEIFIIPLVSIIESIQVNMEFVNSIAHQAEVYQLREEYLPIIRLHDRLQLDEGNKDLENGLLVVVEADGKRAALMVDDLLGQQQVVIKSLETNFHKMMGISGATILGDGTVSLILDVAGLMNDSVVNAAVQTMGSASGKGNSGQQNSPVIH
ncbi:MAG: chemotaxis protein CheA [Gammaproteobacteria bacterium]|jgi:two-component system chemotaxis sensor kinase CheA|nr:chemotaxis protein CheA [Gammaproteobacteria bacterium]MBT4607288.1 chemotaxis protein CheA [Thiotrichales bacterium]MBT3473867.1 chemotaxis protein CheA [Gammaproteobacteria bacterium]MBT3892551.1 chemotaxis protein CheA [Gammaproteobacteria bacterium]MBT3966183.1 chemotaxis protein CheA [Gammaproteobacteria bacterium]